MGMEVRGRWRNGNGNGGEGELVVGPVGCI